MGPNETHFLTVDVDISLYRAAVRKVHHVFRDASREMEVMVVNFARFPELSVPMSASFYSGGPLGYQMSSHTLTPSTVPPNSKMALDGLARKYRSSSKTL